MSKSKVSRISMWILRLDYTMTGTALHVIQLTQNEQPAQSITLSGDDNINRFSEILTEMVQDKSASTTSSIGSIVVSFEQDTVYLCAHSNIRGAFYVPAQCLSLSAEHLDKLNNNLKSMLKD